MAPRIHDDASGACLGTSAQLVWETLRRRGALFFADLHRLTGLLRCEVEDGLWELVAAGFVTADAFDNLRGLISRNRRVVAIASRSKRPRNTAGRWSLLWSDDDKLSVDVESKGSKTARSDERIEATCWMLLRRYGVVFREILSREPNLPKWRELQWAYRRLEDRGEVRGGRFVSGFIGEQFAMPIAAESLRESRRLPASEEIITVSAADPLNLVGIIVPGERITSNGPRTVAFRDGVYLPASEATPFSTLKNPYTDDPAGRGAAV
jgi:ATP-dependent Lhr-like helicase